MKKRTVWWGLAVLVGLGFLGRLLYVEMGPLQIEHMELHYLPENRLRLKIVVQLSKSADVKLKYWRIGGKDTLYAEPSLDGSTHEIILYNLHERAHYKYQVIASKGEEQRSSKIYPFEIKPIYQTTPYFLLDVLEEEAKPLLEKKFFLTQILTEPGAAVVLDMNGDIVWYEPFTKGVKVTSWTKDNTVLCILGSEDIPSSGGDEIVEVDRKGNHVTHFKLGEKQMDKMVHHEVRKDADGNIYAITFDKKVFDLSLAGGTKQDTVNGDGIVVFDKKGNKVWEWSVLDHLDVLHFPNILKAKKDISHANSLFDDGKGNFLMSFRDLNQIWKIDRKSGKVLWKFGLHGDFPMLQEDQFYSQHMAHMNALGELMLLDNGVKTKQSRALSFVLDEQHKTAVKSLEIKYPALYFSSVKGNSCLLDNGLVLTCLTDPRAFFITDKNGRVLWKMEVGGDPYRIEEINFIN
ncbi:aryl-sulfate sulfotransferase [Sphingobacterium sp. LRF_L2]|uniref:aryl-sulfate sulfotransferase n=1 Tax=Sphingobacterium sp. LRF_L2 TaxID=3369421 RepID=UPI003F5EC68A